MEKKSSLLFSVFSLLFLALIIWFASIGMSDGSWNEKIESLKDNWGKLNSLATIWRLEALVVIGIVWVSFNLSSITKWWNMVAIGHILMLFEYTFMLGGYKEISSEESFMMLNEMANWTFLTSNMIWVLGMIGVFYNEAKTIRVVGVILSGISFVLIASIFLGLASQKELMPIAMPAVLLLYLYNSIYGITLYRKIKNQSIAS